MRATVRALVLCAAAFALAASVLVSPAAEAGVTRLCVGYDGCRRAGMSPAGYAVHGGSMYWRMYSGHNCTNYAAYRLVRSGMPNERPWSGGGNATYWGTSMASITDRTPAVGSIAWWRAGVPPAGSAGHVAYVEEVISDDEIIVSQDSWGGDFSWARITRGSSGWPSGFIHFNDVPLVNETKPEVTGTARVGAVLTARAGTWTPGSVATSYQWRVAGADVAGATGGTLRVTRAMLGRRVRVAVTATRPGYPDTRVLSPATGPVEVGELVATTPPTVTGEPRVDVPLTASPGVWNTAPDSLTYQWSADGSPVAGATQATFVPGPREVGASVAVTVTARRTGYADVAVSVPAASPVAAGVLDVTGGTAVAGVPRLGETLRVDALPSAPGATRTIEWLRAGTPVLGAAAPTYELTAADLGGRVRARVTLSREGYAPVVQTSPPTGLVKTEPSLTATLRSGRGRLLVDARVRVTGLPPLTGPVRVRSGGAVVAEATFTPGAGDESRARLVLTGLPAGTRTYKVVLPASLSTTRTVLARRVSLG